MQVLMISNFDDKNIIPFSSIDDNSKKIEVNVKRIEDPSLTLLAGGCLKKLEKIEAGPNVKEILKKKAVAMALLDKSGRIKGKNHPDTKYVGKFSGGAYTSASKEVVNQLSDVSKSQKLSKKSQEIIGDWIENESQCSVLGSILDDWCSLEEFVKISTSGDNPDAWPTDLKKMEAPHEEVEIFSNAIANHIRKMEKGQFFIIPSGSLGHCTRMRINKMDDNMFEIIHFNTGLGLVNATTANKYGPINGDLLEQSKFWKSFVETKMTPDMDALNRLLSSISSSEPQRIDKEFIKPVQETGSCSFQATQAEFKYYFISRFAPNIEEGYREYKKIKYYLTTQAIQNPSDYNDSKLLNSLEDKEKLGRRYLDWLSIIDNPEKYKALKEAYFEAIISVNPDMTKDQLEKLIEDKSELKCLSILNNYLDNQLKTASYEKLQKIRNSQNKDCLVNGVNYLGMRQTMWINSNREFIKDLIDSKGIKGAFINAVKTISAAIMPKLFDDKIQDEFTLPSMDPAKLSAFLKDFIIVEDPVIAKKQLTHLLENECIDQELFTELMIEHIRVQDPSIRKKLMDELRETGVLSDELYRSSRISFETDNESLGNFINSPYDQVVKVLDYLLDEDLIPLNTYIYCMNRAESSK